MTVLEASEIQKIIPHRYPMLLVDRIIELEPMKRAVGIKNITMNEMQFLGHFPGDPIMPGVLMIEAMAQVGGVALLYPEENRGKIAVFGKIDNVRFRKQIIPGDQVITEAIITKSAATWEFANVRAGLTARLPANVNAHLRLWTLKNNLTKYVVFAEKLKKNGVFCS